MYEDEERKNPQQIGRLIDLNGDSRNPPGAKSANRVDAQLSVVEIDEALPNPDDPPTFGAKTPIPCSSSVW
jgi:hypothetical protein